jgi:hypothetical protein
VLLDFLCEQRRQASDQQFGSFVETEFDTSGGTIMATANKVQHSRIATNGGNMTALENATKFLKAFEALKGWAGCKQYVVEGASFTAQSEPLIDLKTVEAYCDWFAGYCKVTVPGATYDIHTSCYDEATRTAVFFATFNATHTGEGGPVPATHQTTHSHIVYLMTMNDENKIESITKVWNSSWALREIGWI